jgi:hypothetical protein
MFSARRLTSIHLSALVTVIGERCFSDFRSRALITFESGSQLSELAEGALDWSGLTSIHLLASVTVIGEFCFCDCRSLVSITFESGSQFSQLAKEAFRGSGLRSIHLPASVTVIGKDCFCDCGSLTSITFDPASKFRGTEPDLLRLARTELHKADDYSSDSLTFLDDIEGDSF